MSQLREFLNSRIGGYDKRVSGRWLCSDPKHTQMVCDLALQMIAEDEIVSARYVQLSSDWKERALLIVAMGIDAGELPAVGDVHYAG